MGCSNTIGACAQLHKVEFAGPAARNYRTGGGYTEISCSIDLSGPGGRLGKVPERPGRVTEVSPTIQLLMSS